MWNMQLNWLWTRTTLIDDGWMDEWRQQRNCSFNGWFCVYCSLSTFVLVCSTIISLTVFNVDLSNWQYDIDISVPLIFSISKCTRFGATFWPQIDIMRLCCSFFAPKTNLIRCSYWNLRTWILVRDTTLPHKIAPWADLYGARFVKIYCPPVSLVLLLRSVLKMFEDSFASWTENVFGYCHTIVSLRMSMNAQHIQRYPVQLLLHFLFLLSQKKGCEIPHISNT